jgi:hypothetical protein
VTAHSFHSKHVDDDSIRLLLALAEQMKRPLIQASRSAELARMTSDISKIADIELIADTGIDLVESYILSLKLQQAGDTIPLESVSLSATLNDVAHMLQKLDGSNIFDVELHIAGKYGPIMAHAKGLQVALLNIGKVLMSTHGERYPSDRPVVALAARKTRRGIAAGIFTNLDGLDAKSFARARNLYGRASQPIPQLTSESGAGIFIADSLLHTMESSLRVSHYKKLTGLAATFLPSQQLTLV